QYRGPAASRRCRDEDRRRERGGLSARTADRTARPVDRVSARDDLRAALAGLVPASVHGRWVRTPPAAQGCVLMCCRALAVIAMIAMPALAQKAEYDRARE